MKNALKYLLVFLFLLTFVVKSQAQNNAYIYIQGDKAMPFYVRIGDKMQPRYGKNYSIIPKLAAGPVTIEILFQQNAYPAQVYTIDVPANGNRGFMLNKHNDVYDLYDLSTQRYVSEQKQNGK